MKSCAAVFFLAFGLYVAAMPPALAPYRDTGEMTLASHTLGVAHPTSYPIYVLLGHLAQKLPLGNRAYRLNLLSALCGAAAIAWLFALCRRRWGRAAGLGAVLLLGLNSTFWSIVQVQEMYSLWVLCGVILMGLAWRLGEEYSERRWIFFAFAYGLCLCNRLDLVLWAPGLLWLALGSKISRQGVSLWAAAAFLVFPAAMESLGSNMPLALLVVGMALYLAPADRWRWAGCSALAAALGLSVYLYLPVRSAAAPFLDWNHPALLGNFLDSILRTRYGGTLDLLSKNYDKGELFGPNLVLYARHLWENFSAAGLAAALGGCWLCLRREPRRWLGMAAAWWWSGPIFLLMANMPPNPHAAAIVEPHYLLSDLVLVFWAAEGIGYLGGIPALALCALLAVVPIGRGRIAQMNRRSHLFSYDYAKNVLRCVAPGGALVAKKDVQLYIFWHYCDVQGWRPDVRVLAQGLGGAPWYQSGWRRSEPGFYVGPLRDSADWRRLLSLDAPVFATMDGEVPGDVAQDARARGLVSAWARPAAEPAGQEPALWELMARRGRYEYEGQPDFFTSDLVSNYAQALALQGRRSFSEGAAPAAKAAFLRAWAWQWQFVEPADFLGFLAFQRREYGPARDFYAFAARIDEETMKLTEDYHSLPELKAAVRRATADAYVQLGVASERLRDSASAQTYYQHSLDVFPTAQAHYNMAILFWNRDVGRAEAELAEAVRLDPRHPEANKYLAALRAGRR